MVSVPGICMICGEWASYFDLCSDNGIRCEKHVDSQPSTPGWRFDLEADLVVLKPKLLAAAIAESRPLIEQFIVTTSAAAKSIRVMAVQDTKKADALVALTTCARGGFAAEAEWAGAKKPKPLYHRRAFLLGPPGFRREMLVDPTSVKVGEPAWRWWP